MTVSPLLTTSLSIPGTRAVIEEALGRLDSERNEDCRRRRCLQEGCVRGDTSLPRQRERTTLAVGERDMREVGDRTNG